MVIASVFCQQHDGTLNFIHENSDRNANIELFNGKKCCAAPHWIGNWFMLWHQQSLKCERANKQKACIWEKVDPMWWYVVTIHGILSTEYGMNKIPNIAYKYILIENAFSIQLNYHFGNSSLFYMDCTVLLSPIVCCYFVLDICANFCLFSFSTMRAK